MVTYEFFISQVVKINNLSNFFLNKIAPGLRSEALGPQTRPRCHIPWGLMGPTGCSALRLLLSIVVKTS